MRPRFYTQTLISLVEIDVLALSINDTMLLFCHSLVIPSSESVLRVCLNTELRYLRDLYMIREGNSESARVKRNCRGEFRNSDRPLCGRWEGREFGYYGQMQPFDKTRL